MHALLAAELSVDHGQEVALQAFATTPALGSKILPEDAVVQMAAAVETNGGLELNDGCHVVLRLSRRGVCV